MDAEITKAKAKKNPLGQQPGRSLLGWGIYLLVILLLEIFAFNIDFWTTQDLQPVDIAKNINLSEDEPTATIDLPEPMSISTLGVASGFSGWIGIELFDAGVGDRGTPFERFVSSKSTAPQNFVVHPFGEVHQIDITLKRALEVTAQPLDAGSGDGESAPICSIVRVVANAPIAFQFSFLRCALFLLAGAIVWGLSARRRIFKEGFCEPGSAAGISRKGWIATIVVAVVVSVLMSCGCMFNTFWLGTTSQDPSTGAVQYQYPRNYEDQYAELAKSLSEGKLSLSEEPSDELQSLENPYNRTQRREAEVTYRFDTALFNGSYYVYYGVVPVILFHLPYYLITGGPFPTYIGCLICMVLSILGTCVLIAHIARRFFPRASLGMVLLCQIIACFSCMLMWVPRYPGLYLLPQISGIMFLVWAAVGCMMLDKKPWLIWLASLCIGCVFGCRPQLGLFALLLVPLAFMQLKALSRSGKARLVVGMLLPCAVILCALGAYNALRFGSPFDFGANYNLTKSDMSLRPFSLEVIGSALFYFFLQLPVVIPSFPFLTTTGLSYQYSGYLTTEPMLGGILWLSPIVLMAIPLLATPLFKARREVARAERAGIVVPERAEQDENGQSEEAKQATKGGENEGASLLEGRWGCAIALLAVCLSVVVAAFDGAAAGVLPRYQLDFTLPLVIVGCFGLLRLSCSERISVRAGANIGKICLACALIATVGILFYTGENATKANIELIGNIASLEHMLW